MAQPWGILLLEKRDFYLNREKTQLILANLLKGNIFILYPVSADVDRKFLFNIQICCKVRVHNVLETFSLEKSLEKCFVEYWVTNDERRVVLPKLISYLNSGSNV